MKNHNVGKQATSLLGLLCNRIKIKFADSSEIGCDTIPTYFQHNDLPSLFFLNLDAASNLLRYHMDRMKKWAESNTLKQIYLDEFWQLISEYGFRSSYQDLRELGRIGVRVMCLSGLLPTKVAMSLMSYCCLMIGLQPELNDTVPATDPIGDGYSFSVDVVADVVPAVVKFIFTERAGACHVICASKASVYRVTKNWRNHCWYYL